jgi:hypothetical protein
MIRVNTLLQFYFKTGSGGTRPYSGQYLVDLLLLGKKSRIKKYRSQLAQ